MDPSLILRMKRKGGGEKPPIRPKPAFLRHLAHAVGAVGGRLRGREGAWASRVRFALAADLLQGRCRAADNAITAINNHVISVRRSSGNLQ